MKAAHIRFWLLVTLAFVPIPAAAQLATVDFQDPPPFVMKWEGGSKELYVMGKPGACAKQVAWNYAHVAPGPENGGWNNRGYVRYTWCSDKMSRVSIAPSGWSGAGYLFKPDDGWPADAFYGRLRIYVEQPIRPAPDGDVLRQFKFFMWHRSVFDGDQRVIGFLENGGNCGKSDKTYICFTLQRNINHRSDTASVAVPVGVWTHLQFAWRHGKEGASFLKVWLNNNDQKKPTAQDLSLTAVVRIPSDKSEWVREDRGYDQPFHLGNSANSGTRLSSDFVLRLMDFELDNRFDPAWNPDKPATPSSARRPER